jgi:GMC oxidoreductase
MGSSMSPFAVTDGKGPVYGVDGLRVADISLFPSMLTSLYLCLISCVVAFLKFLRFWVFEVFALVVFFFFFFFFFLRLRLRFCICGWVCA